VASDEDNIGAVLADEIVGLSVSAFIGALANRSDPQTMFMSRLQAKLPEGVVLVAADLGRDLTRPVWILTLRLPSGSLISLHAPVKPEIPPRDPSLGDEIAQRIINYLRPHGLLTV
jgi:hypothetical protein